jgi:UDP-glucose 4-epimerase
MTILVTGGAGYIGSHTVLALLEKAENVIVLDNLVNSSKVSLDRVAELTSRRAQFIEGDLQDKTLLQSIFNLNTITSVIHFAALKAVGESSQLPLEYYQNNVNGTLELLKVMQQFQTNQLIFSSSATVYGPNAPIPYVETTPIGGASSPYGQSKIMIEQILQDYVKANPAFRCIALRYFNPVGAHHSGEIGENPNGVPNNLLPYIAQVAVGKLSELSVFGDDYPTPDGTCQRDYIHVMDLAEGHLAALEKLAQHTGYAAYNLGAGKGYSVLEMIKAFEEASGQTIPFQIKPRRAGDVPAFWANPELAKKELNWQVTRDLACMMRDTWNWQRKNPNGF